jgi:hypothetical protein
MVVAEHAELLASAKWCKWIASTLLHSPTTLLGTPTFRSVHFSQSLASVVYTSDSSKTSVSVTGFANDAFAFQHRWRYKSKRIINSSQMTQVGLLRNLQSVPVIPLTILNLHYVISFMPRSRIWHIHAL